MMGDPCIGQHSGHAYPCTNDEGLFITDADKRLSTSLPFPFSHLFQILSDPSTPQTHTHTTHTHTHTHTHSHTHTHTHTHTATNPQSIVHTCCLQRQNVCTIDQGFIATDDQAAFGVQSMLDSLPPMAELLCMRDRLWLRCHE